MHLASSPDSKYSRVASQRRIPIETFDPRSAAGSAAKEFRYDGQSGRPTPPGPSHISPEEFPWPSLEQGGEGAHLFPARVSAQLSEYLAYDRESYASVHKIRALEQGDSIRAALRPILHGQWVDIQFVGYPEGFVDSINL